ncbi:MAG TPA: potassium channel family protein [Mycobacteriales bacterium]|nr:potassium channel family protein [Mycobacteriales bacterium]
MDAGTIVLPRRQATPFRSAGRRLLVAVLVLLTIATVVSLDPDGYSDVDGSVSWFDGLYYATVSASTTGYGDIAPVTDQARLVNVLVVTPLRVLFVVALIGSAFEVVTTTARELFRRRTYRQHLHGHTVVVGYGTRGRAAVRALLDRGVGRDMVIAIDSNVDAADEAIADGIAAVHGDATRNAVQRAAFIKDAAHVIVAVSQDATSVLATLTSRRLAPSAQITASVRETVNVPLLHSSGADNVVVSSETAGRLLGVAVSRPAAASVLTDLLTPHEALGLHERPVEADDVGRLPRELDGLVIAVVRGGQRLLYCDERVGRLREGDVLVEMQHRSD